MTDSDPVLSLDRVRFRWPGQTADTVAVESLRLQAGEHLFVRGPSGSGKTTLLNLLAGIHSPSDGEIRLLGTDLSALPPSKRDQFRADHMGIVFQQFNLLPYLNVIENVTLSCAFSKRKHRRVIESAGVEATARQLLEALNLAAEVHHAPVHRLSVGQQQRVAVARALIGGPELLVADEPTSALDADNRDRLLDLLFDQPELQGCTVVFVSHDRELADRFGRSLELSAASDQPEPVS